jgi:hypothetical protein
MRFDMYNHLFGDKDFTANIMAMENSKRIALLAAWKSSKFEK